MGYLLAVDVGTSSCRAVLYTSELKEMGWASQSYDLLTPEPGYAEQDPDTIFHALLQVIRKCVEQAAVDKHSITTMSWGTVMHSMIALDSQKRPLTKVWTWADTRSVSQAAALESSFGMDFYERTGCPIHAMYWPAKIRYLQEEQPKIWAETRFLVSLKEYLLLRFTGQLIVDESVASTTGLWNIQERQWDPTILAAIGLREELLSPSADPLTIWKGITSKTSSLTGLRQDIEIVLGCSDGALSNVGSGALSPGIMAYMVGTSGAVRVTSERPLLHPQGNTWCYYIAQDLWIVGGASNNGGNVLKWFRDNMAGGTVDYEQISELAAASLPGSNGLLFLPFLAGERFPYDPKSQGAFLGLTLSTEQSDIARAMMEGVAFQLLRIFEDVVKVGSQPTEIRVTGGIVNSPVWLEIVANVLGRELVIPLVKEASALGAAMLALVATKELGDLQDAAGFVEISHIVQPQEKIREIYLEKYALYKEIERLQIPSIRTRGASGIE